jgi:valyl-tRNA synthetase
MESSMLIMIKSQNPDKVYPSKLGQKWSYEEETALLDALNKNIDIEIIAQNHNRSKGGIYSRRQHIAYRMYLKNISIEEIIEKTKLDEKCIKKIIEKKESYIPTPTAIKETKKPLTVESEVSELKNEIKELKNTIKGLVEMMKAVYEFEDL